jgi:hypothetical protein
MKDVMPVDILGKKRGNRHFRNEKREYLKDKMNELATNSNNKKKNIISNTVEEDRK